MSAFIVSLPPAPFLVLGTAAGYALATIGMKFASQGQSLPGIVLTALGFLIAFLSEIWLMRQAELPVIYIAIIAVETLMVLLYAAWIGEGPSLKQALGAGMVLAGLVVVAG
ncbi:5-aminolevulinate synthase [Salipiger abyssi]|uniref:5-aminolevulinate synthase n=1 Tax=Salipiger abyssi TaxID=1250539 RepID=UPI004057E7EC